MQSTLRQEKDGDQVENYAAAAVYKTGQNQYEVYCGTCGKVFYTDKDNSEKFSRMIDQGLDNPFLCDDCKAEYEELAVEDR